MNSVGINLLLLSLPAFFRVLTSFASIMWKDFQITKESLVLDQVATRAISTHMSEDHYLSTFRCSVLSLGNAYSRFAGSFLTFSKPLHGHSKSMWIVCSAMNAFIKKTCSTVVVQMGTKMNERAVVKMREQLEE